MSKKNTGNKINTSKYNQYTAQGADLNLAHSEYAEYHEANHHSFFNMNNAAGLFKIIIIGGIILILVVALSPLFKLFKGLVGAGSAALGFFNDLVHMCETDGACIPTNAKATSNPKAGIPGTCDGKGSKAKGAVCVGWPKATKPNQKAPPAPCGQTVSKLCKTLLAGWVFSKYIAMAGAGLAGLYSLWKNKDPGEQGEHLKDLETDEKETADDIKANASDAVTTSESDDGAREKTVDKFGDAANDARPKLDKDLPKWHGSGWEGPPEDTKYMYKKSYSYKHCPPCYKWKPRSNTDQVSTDGGWKCSGKWAKLRGYCSRKKGGSEGDMDHAMRKQMGWEYNEDLGRYEFNPDAAVGTAKFKDAVKDAATSYKNAATLNRTTIKEFDKKVWNSYEKLKTGQQAAHDAATDEHNSAAVQAEEAAKAARLQKLEDDVDAVGDGGGDAVDDQNDDGDDGAVAGTTDLIEDADKVEP